MATVRRWSGAEARALRTALRFSVRGFAEHIGISPRTVSKWEAGGASMFPLPDTQSMLDTVLSRADADAQERFDLLCRPSRPQSTLHPVDQLGPNTSARVGVGHFDVKPIDYFRAARRTLVGNDNVFGAQSVVFLAEKQLLAVQECCQRASGVDLEELLHLRTRLAEFHAWLHQDLGDHVTASRWIDRAWAWATAQEQEELTAYILARKTQLACDMHQHADGAELGEVAIRAAPTERLRAIASTYTAHAYAIGGDALNAERLYDSARILLSRADAQERSGLGMWLDDSYIDIHQACSFRELRMYHESADLFVRAIDQLAPDFHRDRGVYLARAANAFALIGDVDRALEAGSVALRIGRQTGSDRASVELGRLAGRLAGLAEPATQELRERIQTSPTPAISTGKQKRRHVEAIHDIECRDKS